MIGLRRSLWAASIAALAAPAAAGITVDGSLGDWGVTFSGNTANYGYSTVPGSTSGGAYGGTTGTATFGGTTFNYHVEDQNDTPDGSASHGNFLNPNYGGQDYDGEFMGVTVQDSFLVVSILTGQRPDNGLSFFSPGDLHIVTTLATFGVEMGGGAGNTSLTNGIIGPGGDGTTYNLKSDGTTNTATTNSTQKDVGSVWQNPIWIPDPIVNPTTDVQINASTPGSSVGQLSNSNPLAQQFVYTWNLGGLHSIYELAIPLSFFGNNLLQNGESFTVQWAPSCGNDILQVGYNLPPQAPPSAPEPSTLALMGLGGFGMAFRRWRRKSAV